MTQEDQPMDKFPAELLLFQHQIKVLHEDVGEIKSALSALSSAITKLALIEERQVTSASMLERWFRMVEKLEERLANLERQQLIHSRAARMIDAGILAVAATAIAFVAKKVGLM